MASKASPGSARSEHCTLICPTWTRKRSTRFTLFRSSSHRTPLIRHTDETRALFKEQSPTIAQVPDENLTHHLPDVDLPANAVQLIWITSVDDNPAGPGYSVATAFIHFPSKSIAKMAQQKRRNRIARRGNGRRSKFTHAKMKAYKIGPRLQDQDDTSILQDLNSLATPLDAAKFVVFHHPEVMNLNPDHAAVIGDIIDNSPLLNDLATSISSQGPGTTDGGWMVLVPATDSDGNPVNGVSGKQIFDHRLSDATLEAANRVVKAILQEVFNDDRLKGVQWNNDPGITVVNQADDSGGNPAARVAYQTGGFRAAFSHPKGSKLHGLKFKEFEITSQSKRRVELEVENVFLRFLAAYVQFLDADGSPLPFEKRPDTRDTDRARFLASIETNDSLMGIPFLTDSTLQKTKLSFEMPDDASQARIIFGTLGLGGGAFGLEAADPSTWTLVFNLGIPTLLLGIGIGLESSGWLTGLLEDPDILLAVAAAGFFIWVALATTQGFVQRSARDPLIETASILIGLMLRQVPRLAKKIAEFITGEELEEEIPFVGTAVRVLSIAADLSDLGQTTGEVLSSPALFDNTVSLTMDTKVTINHDPEDFQFPAVANKYIVRATYDKKVVREICGTLTTAQSDPIVVTFRDVPAGGKVQIDTWFLSNNNWVAGHGSIGPIDSIPELARFLDFSIKENEVPLTANTLYSHKQKLTFQDGSHAWIAANAPSATRADLDCGRDDTLCELNGITVSQLTGMAGYSWQSGGQNVGLCGGGATPSQQLHTIQNVFLGQRPEDGLKFSGCGYPSRPAIAYDLLGPADGTGKHFYVDPNDGEFHLRKVTLDDTTPFDMNQTMSWGRFSQNLDSIVVHPAGYVAGINRDLHKLEIIDLPAVAIADDQAPSSTLKSGKGTREGLIDTPVAVAAGGDGALLILEAGNARIQAFDVFGNPVHYFENKTTSITDLRSESLSVTHLDMAVEQAAGYIYVLSYTGAGDSPSDYRLDIYTPTGGFLTRTEGVVGGRFALDFFRNVYTQNFETIQGPGGRLEPSISEWIPSTPPGDDPTVLEALVHCNP